MHKGGQIKNSLYFVLTQVCKLDFRPHLSHEQPPPLYFFSIVRLYTENPTGSILNFGETDENDQVSAAQLVSEAFPEISCHYPSIKFN